jgi:hypothetical protein
VKGGREMQKVLIVKEGRWGLVEPKEYQEQIEFYQKVLDRAEAPSLYGRGKEKAAEVRLVETAEEAEKITRIERVKAIVFVSRGMEVQAEKFAEAFPKTKVIVFTGAIPEGKVIWVNKACMSDSKQIQDIVLWW